MLDSTRTLLKELDSHLAAKTFTAEILSHAVRTIDEILIRESIGSFWLFERRPVYAGGMGRASGYTYHCSQVFGEGGIDALEFLRNHKDVDEFVRRAIRSKEFMEFLPSGRRAEIVREAYLGLDHAHNGQASACLKVGISREASASMIRARLEKIVVREGNGNQLSSFIEYGLGESWNMREEKFDLPDDSDWAVFDDNELKEVMLMAAQKAPNDVLRYKKKIGLRLSSETVLEVCHEAAKHLASLRCLELGHLDFLALEEKARILSRVMPDGNNSAVLAGLAVELIFRGFIDGHQANVREVLEKLNGGTLFRTAYRASNKDVASATAWDITRGYFYDRLHKDGYTYGVVEEETFPHKKKGNVRQLVVNKEGKKYVFDDRDHRWFPSKGDPVIVNVRAARSLTPRVFVAYFLPIEKEVR